MKCPVCNYQDSKVLDSRPVNDGVSIKRRRECPGCGKRFNTYEVVDTVPITVIKRNGEQEFFDKHKLMLGIERACRKRPLDPAVIADEVESDLQNEIVSKISSQKIGELVLSKLREVDIVSYIRFASVYREFSDIDSFMSEIKSLNKSKKKSASPSSVGGKNG